MTLQVFNTLTRKLEPFTSLVPGEVRLYVCGMTVYDLCHLGHARSMIAFDLVRRWLLARGWRVTFVRNVTDIDDKIIARAAQNGERIHDLTERMIERMHADAARLFILPPDHEPRATHYVPQMIALIERLLQRGLAYRAANGDVCYSVHGFAGYGQLSGKKLEDLRVGARVEAAEGKRDALDFVLWKAAKPDEPPEARWDSPFGIGRPGWHIECSAMSMALLGEEFDIHGGGADLQFPHHDNEIAQSQGASGKPMARYWLHNGFVRVDEAKMSKSLGNFFTIEEVADRFGAEVTRFFIVRTHYRSPLNYSDAHLQDARQGLSRLYTALNSVPIADLMPGIAAPDWNEEHAQRFAEAMDTDFDTPRAVAALFDLAGCVLRATENSQGTEALRQAQQLRALGGILGLLQDAPQAFLQQGAALSVEAIEQLIAERARAKRAKNFALADSIREQLTKKGIALLDSPSGTTWRQA